MWYEREPRGVVFFDLRSQVRPNVIGDSRWLPFKDAAFESAVFDPPHLNYSASSIFSAQYGHFATREIRETIKGTGRELARVVRRGGLLILKWSDHSIKMQDILVMLTDWRPLYGTQARRGPKDRPITSWTIMRNP